jgi:hypothetical protein
MYKLHLFTYCAANSRATLKAKTKSKHTFYTAEYKQQIYVFLFNNRKLV